ncbi:DUF1254 domain-containing protein [Bordetella genomosp. 12]|uniref:DUF1254 domain-containing protein n=1 Tax=Bordetella genomosp. 12 TaxID=463035 RepID=A0A261VTT7_9BORD|nr:DUF1254 domain-containing protein [Bordetella genomosp. 12]OZI77237.1 hypothetical protein CAL22_01410 [Bordetella genomosp. 12]
MRCLNAALLALAALAAPVPGRAQPPAAPPAMAATAELPRLALDAYVYLYPLVSMDLARRQAVSAKTAGQPGHAPANHFWLQRGEASTGAWPHADMQQMNAWLDLDAGPVVISVPPTQGRLYTLTLHDLWGDAFAVVGKRSTGTGRGNYAVVPPGWPTPLPPGMQRIDAPTGHVWLTGLLQAGEPGETQQLQDAFILTPLQDWNRGAQSVQVKSDPTLDAVTPPKQLLARMPAEVFFAYAADLLRRTPAHDTDQPMAARLRRLGIVPGQQFDFARQDNSVQQALRRAAREGPAYLAALDQAPQAAIGGWVAERQAMGAYGAAYLKRAQMALRQPGAELPEDVLAWRLVSDAAGRPIDAATRYVLRFEPDALPPGDAFWALAAFDAQGQPLTSPYRRHSVGDRDPLRFNPDGSLELYLQADPPPEADRANWLPLSGEDLRIVLRVYLPAAAALDGHWNPPPLAAEPAAAAPQGAAAAQ